MRFCHSSHKLLTLDALVAFLNTRFKGDPLLACLLLNCHCSHADTYRIRQVLYHTCRERLNRLPPQPQHAQPGITTRDGAPLHFKPYGQSS